jgi:hypothetical protein
VKLITAEDRYYRIRATIRPHQNYPLSHLLHASNGEPSFNYKTRGGIQITIINLIPPFFLSQISELQ